MLHLTFYRGVPFDREQQNVLFVDNDKRNEFLTQYIVPIQTLRIDQFALLGSTNNPFLVVSLDKEPFNVNYLKVIQSLQNANGDVIEERLLFYYVDNYEMVGTDAVRLNLTMDYFQTYFNGYDMTTNQMKRPEIKNALVTQGHGFEQGGEIEEIIQGDKVQEYFTIEKPFTRFGFYLVLHTLTESNLLNETCLISQRTYTTYEEAIREMTKISQIGTIIVRTGTTEISQEEVTHHILNAYLIPADFIVNNFLVNADLATAYFDSEETNSIFFYTANLGNDKTPRRFSSFKQYDVEPNESEITLFGTGANNIELKYNGKIYEAVIQMVIANDLTINLVCDKQIIPIESDYEINVTYDEYTNYMAQSVNSRKFSTMSKAIAGATAFGAGIGEMAGGNIAGGLKTALLGVGASAISIGQEQASLKDMDSKPPTLQSDTGSLIVLDYYGGLATIRMKPANQNVIQTYNKYFGFKFNGFNETLNLEKQTETQKFRFCQCAYLSMIGDFNFEIKERLESYFTRGIRLWYDKDTFLNGFEP